MADKLPKFYPIDLGALPHERVSKALGIVMPQGIVHYSALAQKHSYQRHSDIFHLCEPFLAMAVASPTYIGQAPKHKHDGFEHVLRGPEKGINVLMAITLFSCDNDLYRVQSVYPIDIHTIMRRLRKGYLTEF